MRKKKKDKKYKSDLSKATPAQVVKAFKGALTLLSEQPEWKGNVQSTGLKAINGMIGIGGLPKGRIIEIFGPESSGKTTIALKVAARTQKDGGKVAYIDAEHAMNLSHAETLGVNTDDLILSQPNSAEEALDIVLKLVKLKAVDTIVVDSVAALVPQVELDKESLGKQTMGRQAELMSRALRRINPRVQKSGVLLIFINQTRMKIGVMFGNPETTSGGMALRFYASVRIRTAPKGQYKSKGKLRGMDFRLRAVKNKIGIPYRTAAIRLIFGKGLYSLKGDGDD